MEYNKLLTMTGQPPLKERVHKGVLVLFDVDGTLSLARQHASQEMLTLLEELRQRVATGFVGGSDLSKQQEQLGSANVNGICHLQRRFRD